MSVERSSSSELPQETCDLIALTEIRATIYRFLAQQLLEPPPTDPLKLAVIRDAWSELSEFVSEELAATIEAALAPDAESLERLRHGFDVQLRIPGSQCLFATESAHLAGAVDETGGWTPGRARGPAWQRVADTYALAGWTFDHERGVEADHLGAELAFCGALCASEAEAWRRGDASGARASGRALSAFIEHHPLRWIRRVEERADAIKAVGYPTAVTRAAERWLRLERRHLTQRVMEHDAAIATC